MAKTVEFEDYSLGVLVNFIEKNNTDNVIFSTSDKDVYNEITTGAGTEISLGLQISINDQRFIVNSFKWGFSEIDGYCSSEDSEKYHGRPCHYVYQVFLNVASL